MAKCETGGTSCCRHKYILLDEDQKQPDGFLTYHMKFRFWYQDFDPATDKNPASHKNLVRFYWQTGELVGEYDIPKAELGTPPEETVHEISTRWKVIIIRFRSHCYHTVQNLKKKLFVLSLFSMTYFDQISPKL